MIHDLVIKMEMNKERRIYLLRLAERIRSQMDSYPFNDCQQCARIGSLFSLSARTQLLRNQYGLTRFDAAGDVLWNDVYVKGLQPLLDDTIVEHNLRPLDIFYMGWSFGRQFYL